MRRARRLATGRMLASSYPERVTGRQCLRLEKAPWAFRCEPSRKLCWRHQLNVACSAPTPDTQSNTTKHRTAVMTTLQLLNSSEVGRVCERVVAKVVLRRAVSWAKKDCETRWFRVEAASTRRDLPVRCDLVGTTPCIFTRRD